jgi:hypothetical protein
MQRLVWSRVLMMVAVIVVAMAGVIAFVVRRQPCANRSLIVVETCQYYLCLPGMGGIGIACSPI